MELRTPCLQKVGAVFYSFGVNVSPATVNGRGDGTCSYINNSAPAICHEPAVPHKTWAKVSTSVNLWG